jgi:hypothetical protein
MSIFDAIYTRAAAELVGSNSNRSEGTTKSKSFSKFEEDLDLVHKHKDVGATACQGVPVFDNYSDSNKECSLFSTTSSS